MSEEARQETLAQVSTVNYVEPAPRTVELIEVGTGLNRMVLGKPSVHIANHDGSTEPTTTE